MHPDVEIKEGADFQTRLVDGGAETGGDIAGVENDEVYLYDAIGNLVADHSEGIEIGWTVYGKIREVRKTDGTTLHFSYDAAGNRVEKKVSKAGTVVTTRYIRDAGGNVMAIYQDDALTEQPLYGSSRLGSYRGGRLSGQRQLGHKQYELSNHLGNVLAVVTDNISLSQDASLAHVVTISDYYPFGSLMPGRSYNSKEYRYGYNGKELDKEGMGGGGSTYDYGFRIYNPQIAKFLSVDPLTKSYPELTPYQYASNTPIAAIDLDGLEAVGFNSWNMARSRQRDAAIKKGDVAEVERITTKMNVSAMTGIATAAALLGPKALPFVGRLFWGAANNPAVFSATVTAAKYGDEAVNTLAGIAGSDVDVVPSDNSGMAPAANKATKAIRNLVKIDAIEDDVMIFSAKIGEEVVEGVTNFAVKDGKLLLNQLHLQGSKAGAVGREALWSMVKDLGKQYKVDEVVIQGGKRTTGKYKGQVPSPITVKVD
jgi:RHS repeat-associated protein